MRRCRPECNNRPAGVITAQACAAHRGRVLRRGIAVSCRCFSMQEFSRCCCGNTRARTRARSIESAGTSAPIAVLRPSPSIWLFCIRPTEEARPVTLPLACPPSCLVHFKALHQLWHDCDQIVSVCSSANLCPPVSSVFCLSSDSSALGSSRRDKGRRRNPLGSFTQLLLFIIHGRSLFCESLTALTLKRELSFALLQAWPVSSGSRLGGPSRGREVRGARAPAWGNTSA